MDALDNAGDADGDRYRAQEFVEPSCADARGGVRGDDFGEDVLGFGAKEYQPGVSLGFE